MVDLGHRIRSSDASSFDEICDICGATDRAGSDALKRPCAPMNNPQRPTDAGCVERVARAIHETKGTNPDCLYQHNFEGDWPEDDRREYADPFTGEPRVMLFHKAWRHSEKAARAAIAALSASGGDAAPSFDRQLSAICDEGWKFHSGPPPEYDSPLSQVYDAGIGYAWDRLAELLGVTDYEGGDGSEDYATDVANTGRNILVAAGYTNSDGDLLTAPDISASGGDAAELADVKLALDWALGILVGYEPGDSRAVSDEFVAAASISSGLMEGRQEARDILIRALPLAKQEQS